jgi:hypothetical protein
MRTILGLVASGNAVQASENQQVSGQSETQQLPRNLRGEARTPIKTHFIFRELGMSAP